MYSAHCRRKSRLLCPHSSAAAASPAARRIRDCQRYDSWSPRDYPINSPLACSHAHDSRLFVPATVLTTAGSELQLEKAVFMLPYIPVVKAPQRRVCALTGGGIPVSSQAQRDIVAYTSSTLSRGFSSETRHYIPDSENWPSPSGRACYHCWPSAIGIQRTSPALHTGCTPSGLAVHYQDL